MRSLIFGWAMRQLNYCPIIFGAIAGSDGFTDAGRSRARNVAVVATIASTHIQILQLLRSDTERQDD